MDIRMATTGVHVPLSAYPRAPFPSGQRLSPNGKRRRHSHKYNGCYERRDTVTVLWTCVTVPIMTSCGTAFVKTSTGLRSPPILRSSNSRLSKAYWI